MNIGKISTCVENAVTTICLTVLAVFFEKWWIVLFSLLFFASRKKDGADK